MAITLADVQVNVQDHLSSMVIDEFRKNNYLLDNLTFEDVVSPSGGGATMTYAYTRVDTQSTAATRAINTEYATSYAKKKRYSVDLKVMGGAFKIDRVLAGMGGIVDEVTFQMNQKIKAVQALFNDMVINGDTDKDANGFNGLDKALKGSSTEMTAGIDLSTGEKVTSNYMAFLDLLDELLSTMDGAPTALMGNAAMMAKIRAAARRASMYQTNKDNWGQQVEYYGNVPLIDLGAKAGTNDPIVATDGGMTNLYAVRLGLDGFHGVSMAGQSPIRTWLPDFSTSGAVKKGEVEMVAAVALKASKAAAVLRNIQVASA
ncbi:MAG: phage capsid protein [Clostridia bacterium]|nr:phage capsid protein [Clostridia bacterium]